MLMLRYLFIVLSILAFMIGLWSIDISVSAMTLGYTLENYFFTDMTPNKIYHLGIFLSMVSFFILVILSNTFTKNERKT